jgi:hypothetical protein
MSDASENKRTPEAIRADLEDHLMKTFHEQRVLFEEGRIRFPATARLDCDEWGAHVHLDLEVEDKTFTVTGAWEVLVARGPRLGAAYVGWSITAISGED